MTRPKYTRRPLNIHPTEWVGEVLGRDPAAVRSLLGKGVDVGEDWYLDVMGRARVTPRHMREALGCIALGASLTANVHDFFDAPHGAKYVDMFGNGVTIRVVDRIHARLKSCGAIAFVENPEYGRMWVATPCEWVEAAE